MSMIMRLSDPGAAEIALSGGKGASLAVLDALEGVEVPAGFVVTTRVFDEYIRPVVAPLLDDDSATSRKIQDAVRGIEFPEDVLGELRTALDDLGDVDVAVRSSATSEDLTDASFAGQQDTYLNIRGFEDVSDALIECFASLYNERALAYRRQVEYPEESARMAVVVQTMVDADQAGVMFTADPTTSDRLTTAIEVVSGLGEGLVSGHKTPTTYTLKAATVTEHHHGDGSLTDAQVEELAGLGDIVQTHYEQPMDIEWCLSGDKFWLVQARPITTLYPCPPSADGFKRCWLSVGNMQNMTDVILPLGISFAGRMPGIKDPAAVGGRAYIQLTASFRTGFGRKAVIDQVSLGDTLTKDALDQILARTDYIKSIPRERAVISFPKSMVTSMALLPVVIHQNNPDLIDDYMARMEANLTDFEKQLAQYSGKGALDFILNDLSHGGIEKMMYDHWAVAALSAAYMEMGPINKAGKELLGRDEIVKELTKSIHGNITSQMGLMVSQIADQLRDRPAAVSYLETAHPADAGVFVKELCEALGDDEAPAALVEEFLAKYGQRCPGEIDITKPRILEDPQLLIASILADLKMPAGEDERIWDKGLAESQAVIDELKAAGEKKWGERKTAKLLRQISVYRNYIALRDHPKYYWIRRYWLYKQALGRIAANLVASRLLTQPDDIDYLSIEELQNVLDGENDRYLRDKIRQRRIDYEHYAILTPPRVMFSDGEVVTGHYADKDLPAGALAGTGVSAGRVTGTARVLADMKDAARVEPGDILVTQFTDPSWTPLFVVVSGLVTEVGGMMTHGAVIAREYGLPAVCGVLDATALIQDGDRLELDGDEGWVRLAD